MIYFSLLALYYYYHCYLVPGIKLRAKHTLDKCSTKQLHPQPYDFVCLLLTWHSVAIWTTVKIFKVFILSVPLGPHPVSYNNNKKSNKYRIYLNPNKLLYHGYLE